MDFNSIPSKLKTNLVDAVKKTFVYKGRATREQYWYYVIATWAVSVVLSVITSALKGIGAGFDLTFFLVLGSLVGIIQSLFGIAAFVPQLSLGFRRMHDSGKPGLFYIAPAIIVALAAIVTLIFGVIAIFSVGISDFEDFFDELSSSALLIIFVVMFVGTCLLYAAAGIAQIVLCVLPSQKGRNKYDLPETSAAGTAETVSGQN